MSGNQSNIHKLHDKENKIDTITLVESDISAFVELASQVGHNTSSIKNLENKSKDLDGVIVEVGEIKAKQIISDQKLDNLIEYVEKDTVQRNLKEDKMLSGIYRFRYWLGGSMLGAVALGLTIVTTTLDRGLEQTRKDQNVLKEFFNVKYENVEKGQIKIEKQINQLIKLAIDGNKNK